MSSDRSMQIREFAKQRLGGELNAFESPLTVLASPAWRGVEADIWLARRGASAEIYKHYHDDIGAYVDVVAALSSAAIAGDLGVGPTVLETRREDGAIRHGASGRGLARRGAA